MHVAQSIVDAVVAQLTAATALKASIFKHRQASLSEDDQQLPAVSVGIGADAVMDGDFDEFASALAVNIIAYARGRDEADVIDALLELRAQIHIAIAPQNTLSLARVAQIRYGGADAPRVLTDSERVVGSLAMTWIVEYFMNTADPTI